MFGKRFNVLTAVLFPALLSVVVVGGVVGGCSSGGGQMKEGSKTIETFAEVRKNLTKAQAEVDQALAAMNKLTAGGDLAKSFSAYTKEVQDVKEAGDAARKRVKSMHDNTKAYIAQWQKEAEQIKDPSIKSGLETRRDAVRAHFDQIQAAGQATGAAYDPFLASLQQIQAALSIDLSPAALPGLKPAMEKAQVDGATLKSKIGALQAELDQMQADMSSTGTAPKK